jgi:hypothetical protein
MNKNYFLIVLFFLSVVFSKRTFAQCTGWNTLVTTDSVFTNPFFGIMTTPEADKLNRPYDYLATVAGGVKVFDNNASGAPIQVASVPTTLLGNLDAINLLQDSIWLYVCLGNIWDTTEMAGLAIIDVSNPSVPVVLDFYVHAGLTGGSGAVVVKGNYAYLAANKNGLIILDISNKSNIQLQSVLPFSNNFPHTTTGSAALYNARGIDVQGNYAYVCYDRGGLRIADVSNVSSPVQVNQYCFPPLIDHATAYNNIVIHNNIAYVAIDYYGVEILDITNPMNITQSGWWHPPSWADTTNNFNTWANSNGHANELAFDSVCNKLYVAAGKSDLLAIDVSNPSAPVTCETYGSTSDAYGTWGLDFFNNQIHVAYIWSPAAPPYSNYTGYKILQTNCNAAGVNENSLYGNSTIFPNPATENIYVSCKGQQVKKVKIADLSGKVLEEHFTTALSISNLPVGIYFISVQTDKTILTLKFIKQ